MHFLAHANSDASLDKIWETLSLKKYWARFSIDTAT